MNIILNLLTSTVIAAIIAAIVSFGNNERTLRLKYVTEERQEWRKKMKTLFSQFLHPYENEPQSVTNRKKLLTEVKFNLNPEDTYDKKIVILMEEILKVEDNSELFSELELRIQVLFKCEWQKAKFEAKTITEEEYLGYKNPEQVYERLCSYER